MQIKLATARGLGYTGDADGLRDPDTNLTYGVKYLAGAYRAANGDHDRAMHYYAGGYYYVAKQQRLERLKHPSRGRECAPKEEASRWRPNSAAVAPERPMRTGESKNGRSPAKPKRRSKPKKPSKKLADAKLPILRRPHTRRCKRREARVDTPLIGLH